MLYYTIILKIGTFVISSYVLSNMYREMHSKMCAFVYLQVQSKNLQCNILLYRSAPSYLQVTGNFLTCRGQI